MSAQLHTLSNGFRIVTEPMPALGSATIGLWVNAGARQEMADQNGIAHFLEHMAFKGTTTRSALQIAEAIEDVGGYINAYTSREVTAYYARVLKEDTDLALDVLSDILLNPIFDGAEIETERGVILQEIGQSLDTPDDVIFDWLQSAAYPDQALGRTILGPADLVSQFDRSDLQRFTQAHYHPGNLILSAAGAIDPDEIIKRAEQIFGHLSSQPAREAEIATFSGGEIRHRKALEQAHFALAFEGPGYLDDEYYTAQLYSSILGGSMSSRLFQEVREKRGLCYTIFAQTGAYRETGMTTIYSGTSAERLDELASVVISEMKKLPDNLQNAELERARTQMKAGLIMGLESSSARAERLARIVQIWGRITPLEEAVAKIEAVTADDIRAYAERSCKNAPLALALYGPLESTSPDLARIEKLRAA